MSATSREVALMAELNDLLQLNYDAVAAYTVAEGSLEKGSYRSKIRQFRRDHQRHIAELEHMIERRGGCAMSLPHASSAFKILLQGVAAFGVTQSVLSAFRANEVQSRDRYARAAARDHDEEVAAFLRLAADDERKHYDWADGELRAMGSDGSPELFERIHATTIDAVETIEHALLFGAEHVRRALQDG